MVRADGSGGKDIYRAGRRVTLRRAGERRPGAHTHQLMVVHPWMDGWMGGWVRVARSGMGVGAEWAPLAVHEEGGWGEPTGTGWDLSCCPRGNGTYITFLIDASQ